MSRPGEERQADLFGPDVVVSSGKRPNPMRALFGAGPPETRCGSCRFLVRFRQSTRWAKCSLRLNTGGRATDHLVSWSTCGKYERSNAVKDNLTAPMFDGLPEKLARLSKFAADVNAETAKTLARKTHPETSHEAARAIVPKLGKLHVEVLALVARNPGKTQNEYAGLAQSTSLANIARAASSYVDSRRVGRRLPELVAMGKLKRGPARKCGVTGRNATTWWPV